MATLLSNPVAGFLCQPIVETFEPVVDSFAQSVLQTAFERAEGACECTRRSHGHISRCGISLVYNFRGYELPGGWEAHHIDPFGPSDLNNCEIVCIACHKTIHGK